MALTNFERTLRAVRVERRRRPLALLVAIAVLAAWGAWAALARVGVHVTSVSGRLEVVEPVQVLRAEVAGRLVAVHARLGQVVAAGDVLYEIDAAEQELAVADAAARREAVLAERDVLLAAIDAAAAAKATGADVLEAALAEAKARTTQARSALLAADREARRVATLGKTGLAATAEIEQARLDASLRRAEVAAAQALAERLLAEEARASSDRATTVERLRQERVRLDGELGALDAARRAAELARERRLVRAPTAGRLGELPELRPGDLVAVGAALGTIVPDGELRAVAWFRAERALGWLRPGARATVRLDAFPWTWFGVVGAEVTEAALEPKDGLVRVELAIADDAGLPLRHGLTGEVEVEVDRASPLALLLRAAGRKSEAGAP
ncbi:MAG: HlyD family efflux transporter periplasmic adaptor subunit [Deltaproteobacteria bacterium]|nr:HlyD family efflux transporter periplasmic adaptor subunit [Deltaproteobacteria bacterium]